MCHFPRAPQGSLLQALEVFEFHFSLGVQAGVESGLLQSSEHGLLSLNTEFLTFIFHCLQCGTHLEVSLGA